MKFNVQILNKDFSTIPLKPYDFNIEKLTWTAFGGCDTGIISINVDADRILDFPQLLRCPVIISDNEFKPSWHGFIDTVYISFDNITFEFTLEELYNRVKVRYAFVSPDNKLADQSETPWFEFPVSQDMYGIRENIIKLRNVDDTFALEFRRAFTYKHGFPLSSLSPTKTSPARLDLAQARITCRCSGWFKTLDWQYYTDQEGFYANHGPGPGAIPLGNGTNHLAGQAFYVDKNVNVKYAYAMMRRVGYPSSNITARIYNDSARTPNVILGTSGGIAGSAIPLHSYTWYRFEFTTAVALTAGALYWMVINPDTSSSSDHYMIRTDENCNFNQANQHALRYTTSWVIIPSQTDPSGRPDLYFRVICTEDTGIIIGDIATAVNQFFTNVATFKTGRVSTPYRDFGRTGLDEIKRLMAMGINTGRLVCADVTPSRELIFYPQADSDAPQGFIDRYGRFYTADMKYIPPYHPPIGKWLMLSSHDRAIMPFNTTFGLGNVPLYFMDKYTYSAS